MSHYKAYTVLPPIYQSCPQPLPSIRDVMLLINDKQHYYPSQPQPQPIPQGMYGGRLSSGSVSSTSLSVHLTLSPGPCLPHIIPHMASPFGQPPLPLHYSHHPSYPAPSLIYPPQHAMDVPQTQHLARGHHSVEDPLMKRKTRNNLPKETTQMLLGWLHMHLAHPYPNLFEKRQLMQITGLNQQQLSNWFINARRRKIKQIIAS